MRIIIVWSIYNDTLAAKRYSYMTKWLVMLCFSFDVTLLPKSDTPDSPRAYYLKKYKPIDIHGKRIVNDTASNQWYW